MSLRTALVDLAHDPLLLRERQTRPRSWAMPLGMSAFLSIIGFYALLEAFVAISQADGTPGASAMARGAMTTAACQYVIILLTIPPTAAVVVSAERERGTLDLLLLSGFSPRRLVWSELSAALAFRILLIVVASPLLLASFLYSGLGVGQFLITELVTVASIVALGALGIALNTILRNAVAAALLTYALAIGLRFFVSIVGAVTTFDVALNPAASGPQAVHPIVFANPIYALQALNTGPSPAGAHLGHLVGLFLGRESDPASWGPLIQPWQASMVVLVGATLALMALAARRLASRPRPGPDVPSPRSLRSTRRPAMSQAGSTATGLPTLLVAAILVITAVASTVGNALAQTEPPPTGARAGLTVMAEPRWGASNAGTWTPYRITMGNDTGRAFEGEVVLVPVTRPPPQSAEEEPIVPPPAPSWPVLAHGATEMSVSPPESSPPPPGDFPSYASPVALAAGTVEQALTLLVVESVDGYRAELRDHDGAAVATSKPGSAPQSSPARTVALLGAADTTEAILTDLGEPLRPVVDAVTRLESARDLPESALGLSGLGTLVVADTDPATFGPDQLQALDDYVAFGGSVVVTGGSAAPGRLDALPEGLVPFVPTGTTPTSLTALGSMVDHPVSTMATVVTGDLRQGRVMAATADGLPLVVQAAYGSGTVVQVTYDPQDEALTGDPVLVDLAWMQALPRALHRFGQDRSVPIVAPEELWAPALDPKPWPALPAPAVIALGAYALGAAPGLYLLGRSRQRPWTLWGTGPALAIAFVLVAGLAAAARPQQPAAVVIDRAGPDEVVLHTTYAGAQGPSPGFDTAGEDTGDAMSSVFAPPGLAAPRSAWGSTTRGNGGGVVTSQSGRLTIAGTERIDEVGTLAQASLERGLSLSSDLRLTGSGPPQQGGLRLAGSVTNQGSTPLRLVRAQLPEGALARIAPEIAPGETLAVDVPFVWARDVAAGTGPLAPPDERLLFAAGSYGFSRAGQAVVTGLAEPGDAGAAHVVVETVALESSEQVIAMLGAPTLVAMAPLPSAEQVAVYELESLPGIKAAAVSYSTYHTPPEVYDWVASAWRVLPPGDRSVGLFSSSALVPSEIRSDGLVRTRTRLFEDGPCCLLVNPPDPAPSA